MYLARRLDGQDRIDVYEVSNHEVHLTGKGNKPCEIHVRTRKPRVWRFGTPCKPHKPRTEPYPMLTSTGTAAIAQERSQAVSAVFWNADRAA